MEKVVSSVCLFAFETMIILEIMLPVFFRTLPLFLLAKLCRAYPISMVEPEFGTSEKSVGVATLIPFLRKFGYLQSTTLNSTSESQSTLDHEYLYKKERIVEAIKTMQKFGALPETGKLDNDTISLLTKPRCGVPDTGNDKPVGVRRPKRYVIGANGWNKRLITYRIENWAPQLSEEAVLSDMRKAFGAWADYARLKFINKPRGSLDDTDISISFGRGYHGDSYSFDGSGGVLAHAFFPNSYGSLSGDIHFDLDENWNSKSSAQKYNNPSNGDSGLEVSFLAVAVHEIGHSLGLSHSPSRDSVMFPYYQGSEWEDNENVRLGYDDIMAMYRLYIEREIQDFGDTTEDTFVTPTPEHPTSDASAQTTTIDYDITTRSKETFTSTSHPTTTEETEGTIPNICKDEVDTITFIRNEIFVFKGKYMWRFKERGTSEPFYPAEISRLFPMLASVSKVDAAFENDKGQLVFFSGKYYWLYDEGEGSGPFPITNFDLPENLEKVDAVFIWNKNRKLYFFSDNLFWRYDLTTENMDKGYPKGIERWRGLPSTGIHSVVSWSDGATYFFKNNKFWKFNDATVHTENEYPKHTSLYWFGC